MSDLVPRVLLGDLDLTDHPFSVEFGADFGAPQSTSEVLSSLLTDGEIELTARDSNRTLAFNVVIALDDMLSLAEAEVALIAECSKPQNELTVDPGDGWAPGMIFETFRAKVEWLREDSHEMNLLRRYSVTMSAAPYVRSMEETAVGAIASGAPPPTPVTTTVDDCSSTTGWSRPAGYPLGSSAGAVSTGTIGIPGAINLSLTRTGAVSMVGTPYLMVDWAAGGPGRTLLDFRVYADGALLPRISSATSPIYGTRSFYSPPNIVSTLRFESSISVASSGAPQFPTGLTIAEIARTNVPPFVGTGRQQFRALSVGGSSRTQGSLAIQHETNALGEVLVYTNADDQSGYQPPLRQYRTAGGTQTTDATTASGARSPLNGGTAETFDIPASALPPGTYVLMARIRTALPSTFFAVNMTASLRGGGVSLGTKNTGRIVGLQSNIWKLDVIDRLELPPVSVPPGSNSTVRITLSSPVAIDIDEAWLFNTDIGALSWVDCGTGTPATFGPSNRLWIDTASLEWPRPAYWFGTAADRSDARHVIGKTELKSFGTHTFPPGDVNVFTLTSNALNAAVSLNHFRRWHSNAAS